MQLFATQYPTFTLYFASTITNSSRFNGRYMSKSLGTWQELFWSISNMFVYPIQDEKNKIDSEKLIVKPHNI